MARAPFSIIERKTAAGRVFMARFYDAEGTVVKTKAFPGAKSSAAAARKAEALLKEGVISSAANPDALAYLRGFWTRESEAPATILPLQRSRMAKTKSSEIRRLPKLL
jgi:hypothetical protein